MVCGGEDGSYEEHAGGCSIVGSMTDHSPGGSSQDERLSWMDE